MLGYDTEPDPDPEDEGILAELNQYCTLTRKQVRPFFRCHGKLNSFPFCCYGRTNDDLTLLSKHICQIRVPGSLDSKWSGSGIVIL